MEETPIKSKKLQKCSFLEGSKGTGGVPPPPSFAKINILFHIANHVG